MGQIHSCGSPQMWVKAGVVALALARHGWMLLLLGCDWWIGPHSPCSAGGEEHGCAASTAICYGDGCGDVVNAARNLGGVEMRGITDENPIRF